MSGPCSAPYRREPDSRANRTGRGRSTRVAAKPTFAHAPYLWLARMAHDYERMVKAGAPVIPVRHHVCHARNEEPRA